MNETRVLLLSDGRPGHYRLSEGVAAAIGRLRPVHIDRLDVTSRLPLPKAFIPKISRRLAPEICLRVVYGLGNRALEKPDMIVSAGGMTLGANTALAAKLGVPNVFCGAIRRFPAERFALILSDDPADEIAPNVHICPKPSAFDPDRLPPPRAIASSGTLHLGVLIGGPIPSAAFEAHDWQALAGLIGAFAAEYDARATIVTGPRTPAEAYAALAEVGNQAGDAFTLVDFREAGPGSSLQALATDVVLVTSDSMSMMTEAALSQRPAIALEPQRTSPSRDDAAIAWLIDKGWLAKRAIAGLTPDRLIEIAAGLTPMRENHLDVLAGVLRPYAG